MFGRRPSLLSQVGVVAAVGLVAVAGLAGLPAAVGIMDGMRFSHQRPSHVLEALEQAARLEASGNEVAAAGLHTLASTPQSDWLTSSRPNDVRQQVRQSIRRAADENRVPVLVAYNLPFRDCSLYSSGGSATAEHYRSWIDGIAEGIQDRGVMLILEPDSLGMIPWYTGVSGELDSCRPAGGDPETAAEDRFEMLNYAVERLKALPNTRVYLDGTHSGWLAVGDAAQRLVLAGVQKADGFALNVSNYERTDEQLAYGTWVSKCIHYGTTIETGAFDRCANQYYPARSNDFSTWARTDAWYARHVDTATGDSPESRDLAHFVIDTSRNGQGPWTPDRAYPDPQTWCNPPGRGLGRMPTTNTGNELADAFLWIKIPGESDGTCDRGLETGATDPAWGTVPPPAGKWFGEQALDLVQNAYPPLPR